MKRPLSADSKKALIVKLLLIIVLAFLAGWFLKPRASTGPGLVEENEQTETIWTCSMHPQIRQSKPGKCPICFMDLIPVTIEQDQPLGPRQISFSPEAVKLMDVQTTPAERKFVDAQIRMAGTVDYDETGLKDITAWVPGRIDRLYVDFTGTEVIKGDHMVRLYSPDLISAQAEYLQAIEASKKIGESASQLVNTSTRETLKASREKLLLLGLQENQIEQIEKSGKPTDYININAPIGGIVIEKHATEGMYVQTGTKIYTIADLSHVWVKLDAYESDIGMITYQQPVKFTVEAYPGETFQGRITFKPPILDPDTRTVKLRVDVPNPDGRLKPGMFVHAIVYSKLSQSGVISDPNLAGKYTCPMHPSVIEDSPGFCPICGMAIVSVESRGLVNINPSPQPPLVIPATAPLITGKRAVVYVKLPDPNRPVFEGREVVLGPRAGDYYIVEEGLAEGELVVTNGNFKIDSALQIQAKPSMMSPTGGIAPPAMHHDHKMEMKE